MVHLWENHVSLKRITDIIRTQTNLIITDNLDLDKIYISIDIDAPLSDVIAALYTPRGIKWKWTGFGYDLAQIPAPPSTFTLKGKVTDESGAPLDRATVQVKTNNISTETLTNGEFELQSVPRKAMVWFSADGFRDTFKVIRNSDFLTVQLIKINANLTQVQVSGVRKNHNDSLITPNPKIKGSSMVMVDNRRIRRNPAASITLGLEDMVSGLLINRNTGSNINQSTISIRSRGTINAPAGPLKLLDGMILSSPLEMLNPDDVDTVWVMKDAASCTPWGVHSGNGIIESNLKKGDYNKPMQVYVTMNATIANRPNLLYLNRLNSPQQMDLQEKGYLAGNYDYLLSNGNHYALPPYVELFWQRDRGVISQSDFNTQKNEWLQTNMLQQASRYLVQPATNLHHYIGVDGGSANNHYYGSFSYDNNQQTQVGDMYERYTGYLSNTLRFKRNTELFASLYYSQVNRRMNGISYTTIQNNYEGLKDANGNNLAQVQDIRLAYADTAGHGYLLNWQYKTLDELALADNTQGTNLIVATTRISHAITSNLKLEGSYRYERLLNEHVNNHDVNSYFSRSAINTYTYASSAAPGFVRRIPVGAIKDEYINKLVSNNVTMKLHFNRSFGNQQVNIYAGADVRSVHTSDWAMRTFGITSNGVAGNLDYSRPGPTYFDPSPVYSLPVLPTGNDSTDNFISYFASGSWIWNDRFTVSATVRKDKSNIFGVQANQKGVPFHATAISWDLNKEAFLRENTNISLLRLRFSHGTCGNANKMVSAQATLAALGYNANNDLVSGIVNPANPKLRWEKINITNLGLDFMGFRNHVGVTIDYYVKNASDLIASGIIDPTTGISTFTGNIAAMNGHGIDAAINTVVNFNKNTSWQTNILVSHAVNEVTNYKVLQSSIAPYLMNQSLAPLEGKPLYSLYALRYEGVDSLNGDPIGYLNKAPSKDYAAIAGSANTNDLLYRGSATPTWFGSIRNTFSYKKWELSFTINWKAGYYFRRNSINYQDVLDGASAGHTDYEKRWQQPGDEKLTNVPSFAYPLSYGRDFLYTYSNALVSPADHIRLKDIRIDYSILTPRTNRSWQPSIDLFLFANNVRLLWKANDYGIDPDYVNTLPEPRSVSIGIKAKF
jgi:TonB-linked SusC/RagA family outer membrane protein